MEKTIKVTQKNYHLKTEGLWEIIAVRKDAHEKFGELIAKHGGINYKSESRSQYITTKHGVYRYSDHWGLVASCKWQLKNYQINRDNSPVWVLAYIKYSDLKSNLKKVKHFKISYTTPSGRNVMNYIPETDKKWLEEAKKMKNYKLLGTKMITD